MCQFKICSTVKNHLVIPIVPVVFIRSHHILFNNLNNLNAFHVPFMNTMSSNINPNTLKAINKTHDMMQKAVIRVVPCFFLDAHRIEIKHLMKLSKQTFLH